MKLSTILIRLLGLIGAAPMYIVDPDAPAVEVEDGEVAGGDDAADASDGPLDDAGSGGDANADADPAAGDDSEVTITLGDEQPEDEPQHVGDSSVIREMRKQHRELARAVRQKDAELAELKANTAPAAVVLGEKPTLEACEFDPDRFERELESYHARKRQIDEQQRAREEEAQRSRTAWQSKVDGYNKQKATLKVADFEESEEAVLAALNTTQQGILVSGLDNPAQLIYALGKSPAKLKELAAITDPVRFATMAGKLEEKVKITPKKTAPQPDRKVNGGASAAAIGGGSAELDKLRAEAAKTGDMSKVMAYKAKMRAAR